ncbi:MAG: alanine--tRNA ligase [Clostridiales bacterium]|nr:alanine--tRNA ligase [Clostridiales bacterium]
MKKLTSEELRNKYIEFFKDKGHKQIASASVIPENDPTVLFTTAGMHPLVPYLLGEKHPQGNRLTDFQKCVRTGDIDEVGDNSHCTFFEMLGNWSLGDYFKQEMIPWSYEFLTSEKYLGIDKSQIAVTVFAGNENSPRDTESAKIWEECGIAKEDIYYLPDNWWGPAGTTGPCGPDSEMFIKVKEKCCEACNPSCDCGAFLEIWNDVFMAYNKTADGKFEPLAQRNVDTGMGLERTLCVLNGKKSVYDTDLFEDALKKLEEVTGLTYGSDAGVTKAFRVILDHTRTAVFMIGDQKGIVPSNIDQGYILRRLLRRAIRYARQVNLNDEGLLEIAKTFIQKYENVYPELQQNREKIITEIAKEHQKFSRTLEAGLREFEKVVKKLDGNTIDGTTAFHLFETFGFPIEITQELAKERNLNVDEQGFKDAFAKHQQLSRAGSEQKFACGLADNQEATTNLHTATHLLHAALKKVISPDINQKGSNITAERLRFDFNLPRPCTMEELAEVEQMVNDVIKQNIPVVMQEKSCEQAKQENFIGLFDNKYGETVKTYSIGEFSKEICGGPHAKQTGDLGTFKIVKEQSSGAGVRRIKAILEK